MFDNLPKSQENFGFTPIKVKDMYQDCKEIYPELPNYSEFLKIVNTMDIAGYNIVSNAQVEELKDKIREIGRSFE